jgi:CHASE2 domain-containing sensor protein
MLRWPATTAFALCVTLTLSGLLDAIEWSLLDTRASLSSRTVQSDLTLVEIDPESLRELNTWPWPRSYHAHICRHRFQLNVGSGRRQAARRITRRIPA